MGYEPPRGVMARGLAFHLPHSVVIYRWLGLTRESMATTTIQLTTAMREELTAMKIHPRETYQQGLERVLDDLRELDSKTRKELAMAEAEIEGGSYVKHNELGTELGF